jgi:hypothetical protein
MPRLTGEDLRLRTLARQFPAVPAAPGPGDIVALLDHLGPIQSQVPRAPFLALAARLPGMAYADLCGLFESGAVLKGTNIRGTVHTSTAPQFASLNAAAVEARRGPIRATLRLDAVSPEDLEREIERYCWGQWRPRRDVVDHARGWLREHDPQALTEPLETTFGASLVWGHSGLCRRPKDGHWERRTDAFHQTARARLADLSVVPLSVALPHLVRTYLAALGPATRDDLSYFFGLRIRDVDAALAALDPELEVLSGPDDERYVDLLGAPTAPGAEPGLRLLPEFDALLVGFHGRHRSRFVARDQLEEIWARANGIFSPAVLWEGRLVGTWRTTRPAQRTAIEVTMLGDWRPLAADLFAQAVADVERALAVQVTDVVVRPRPI